MSSKMTIERQGIIQDVQQTMIWLLNRAGVTGDIVYNTLIFKRTSNFHLLL